MERLSAMHPDQPLGRADVEQIFSVKRTEARRIIEIAGPDPTPEYARAIVLAGVLLRYVESRRGEVKKERKRKNAIAHVVATEAAISPARHSTFKLPKVPSFDELGDAVSFREGALTIQYSSFEDLMAKLVSMGQAALHKSDLFQELVEKSLEKAEVANG
jgi:hypothetical protein